MFQKTQEQCEDGSVVPPQAQEVRANAEPSMQPPASQVRVKRQRDLGRRRHYDTDDVEDYTPNTARMMLSGHHDASAG
jgi:hypothetical protein